MITPYKQHVIDWKECRRCALCETRTRTVLCRGNVPAQVVFIGEAPGASEDVKGTPFFGPAGHLLNHIIERAGLVETPTCITNLLGCIPKPVPPTVVNKRHGICDMMIDRSHNLWGNPFVLGKDGNRRQVIDLYREWVLGQPKVLEKLPTLSGLRLGCHCKPLACHGDVLVELFKRFVPPDKTGEPPEFAVRACAPRVHEVLKLCKPELVVLVGKHAEKYAPKGDWKTASIMHPAAILRMDVSQKGLAIQRTVVTLADAVEDL